MKASYSSWLIIDAVPEREMAVDSSAHQPIPDEPIPTLSWPPETFDPTSGDEDSLMGLGASNTSNNKPTASGEI